MREGQSGRVQVLLLLLLLLLLLSCEELGSGHDTPRYAAAAATEAAATDAATSEAATSIATSAAAAVHFCEAAPPNRSGASRGSRPVVHRRAARPPPPPLGRAGWVLPLLVGVLGLVGSGVRGRMGMGRRDINNC